MILLRDDIDYAPDRLIESQATTGRNASFFQALAFDKDLGATRGIDAALKQFNLDALVLPAPGFTTVPAAIAGYPIVTGVYWNARDALR